ncbi:MAG: ABC transporter transmembrane domain-containing protein, partial [Candidatus Poribacteria bacterium]
MSSAKRLFKYMVPYIGSALIAFLCTMLIAFCEMGYVSILAETIDAVKLIDTNGLPTEIVFFKSFSLQKAVDQKNISQFSIKVYLADSNDAIRLITYIILFILVIFIIKGMLTYGKTYIMSRIGQKMIFNLRNELYSKLVHFPLRFFSERKAGDIISRGTNDMTMISYSVNSMAEAVQAFATVMVFLVMMLIKSWQLTLLAIFVFPPTMYIINRFGKKIKRESVRIQSKLADISSYFARTISGIKVIKSFA